MMWDKGEQSKIYLEFLDQIWPALIFWQLEIGFGGGKAASRKPQQSFIASEIQKSYSFSNRKHYIP